MIQTKLSSFVALVFLLGLVSVSLGQSHNVTVPGVGNFELTLAEVPCLPLAQKFVTDIAPTATGECSVTNLEGVQWARFRAGYTGTFFPAISTSTGLAHCNQQADATLPDETRRELGRRMCDHVNHLVAACQCDRVACVTTDVIAEISFLQAPFCTDFPERLCLFSQGGVDSACSRALLTVAPPSFNDINFDPTKVPHSCTAADCRNPASSGSGIKMSTGGAFLSAAVAALVAATMAL